MDQSYENETRLRQDAEHCKREMAKLQDKVDQTEAELRRLNREKEQLNSELNAQNHIRNNDIEKLELEITQLNTERDQLVRQLEKSQDMLLTFQQDLNMTENELKRVTIENRRLREESGASEKGIIESKEREIRNLTEKVRNMENDYDMLLQKEGKDKLKADREIAQLQSKIDYLEAEVRSASRDRGESSRYDVEIARLTKERDLARTELGVCKHDLERIERDLVRVREEAERLKSDRRALENGVEKGAKEILESKDKEIDKLIDRVNALESEIDKIKAEKEALEKELQSLKVK